MCTTKGRTKVFLRQSFKSSLTLYHRIKLANFVRTHNVYGLLNRWCATIDRTVLVYLYQTLKSNYLKST